MTEKEQAGTNEELESIPKGQILFDRIFLWLLVGTAISVIMYNVWGMVELFRFVK